MLKDWPALGYQPTTSFAGANPFKPREGVLKVRSRLHEIAEYIRDNPGCSSGMINRYFNIKPSVAHHSLRILKEQGAITEIENKDYVKGINALYGYIFVKDAPRYLDAVGMVGDYLRKHGKATSAEVKAATGYENAGETLYRMVKAGVLVRTGSPRKYVYEFRDLVTA